MADIFNKTPRNVVGGFSVDKATLNFPVLGASGKSSGLLIQNIQINYQQQVSFVYDLAKSDDVYYIAGRASGTLAIGKIVGSKGVLKTFYQQYGNVCDVKGKNITLSGMAGCQAADVESGTITIREPVIASFGLTMNVDTAIIGENCQMIFATLELG
jgi:hypothetical protein